MKQITVYFWKSIYGFAMDSRTKELKKFKLISKLDYVISPPPNLLLGASGECVFIAWFKYQWQVRCK